MLDHMILTVSNVERALASYEAALKPLNIKFFLPYKGEGDQRSGAFSWSQFKGCGRWPGSSLTEKHLNKWRESRWRYLFDRANEDSASIGSL